MISFWMDSCPTRKTSRTYLCGNGNQTAHIICGRTTATKEVTCPLANNYEHKGVMMYRIRPGCAVYARMNIPADHARRMMYIVETNHVRKNYTF